MSARVLPMLAALALVACGARPGETLDAGAGEDSDAGLADAASLVARDAGSDGGASEGPDASRGDTGFKPDPACGYAAGAEHVASCGGSFTEIDTMAAGHPSITCLSWFQAEGEAFASFSELLAELGCDTSCIWTATGSGDFVWCNVKGGYTQLTPGGPDQTGADGGCESMVYVVGAAGSDYAASLDAFEQAHPCH